VRENEVEDVLRKSGEDRPAKKILELQSGKQKEVDTSE
jgi:hypothetical protein